MTDVRVRRVGFRNGTDGELAALHAVESVVDAERRADHVAQPLDSYIAFARNLPPQFGDHTWLVESPDGTPVGTFACWSNAAGDERLMNADVFVLRDWRRRGIGRAAMRTIAETCREEGRSLLTWSTFDGVPAGEPFSLALGARIARVNRTSDLTLAAVDWRMVGRWVAEGPDRAPGYSIEWVDGAFPPPLRDDAATFHHVMNTQPQDDLQVGDVLITADDVAALDRALLESGRTRWTILVRDPSGACVGGTAVTLEPWRPDTVLQENTAIDPGHRGRGLAKWAKAAMLERIRAELPAAERVRTGNAFSNAPMLAINDALGFEVTATRTEWQAEVPALLGAPA